jgi:hypothetical protein
MKIYISKYRNHWISPYTILEKVCFWEKDRDSFYNLEEHPNHKYQKWVDRLNPICVGLQKFLDFVHPRIEYIKIDKHDTWNMDSTLAPIILPMLKQLKETNHGSGIVDLEDVPEHMRTTETEEWDYQQCFDFYHESDLHGFNKNGYNTHDRWNWVLDEMIWAFEQICDDDNDKQFHSGVHDMKSVPCEWDENGKPTLYTFEEGPNHTAKFDIEGYRKHYDRINNGTRLFGKYYRNLWD